MINYVDKDNFNPTCKGYVIRALKYVDMPEGQAERILNSLSAAFDEMTMEQARKEYEKYCNGKITFK